jgi:hypothetical protein
MAAQPGEHPTLFYHDDERRAQQWLEEHYNPEAVVFTASRTSGGRLVAATGLRVFLGSWFKTVAYDDKVAQAARFYDPATSDDWRRAFLDQTGAQYIWYDDDARDLGAWNPYDAPYLEPVIQSERVTLFRVQP